MLPSCVPLWRPVTWEWYNWMWLYLNVTFMCSSMETSNMRMIQLDVTVFECYLHVFLYGDHQHENDTTGCDCIWMLPSCVPLWRPSTWEWYNWMWLYLNVTFMCSSMETSNMRMIQLDVTVFECYLHVFLYGDQQHENDTTGCYCIWMLPSCVPLWRPVTWEWYNWMWLYLNVTFMCSSMETSNMRMIQLDVTVFECYLHVFLYGDQQHENDTTGCDCIWMLPSCVPLWRPATWEWYNWMWLYLNVTFMCSSMETSNMRMIQLDVTVFECYLPVFLYGDNQYENDTTGYDCIWMLPSCVPLWRPATWEWYNWMWLYLNVTFTFLYGDQQHENDTTGCYCIWMLPSCVPLWRPATWEWYNWMWLYLNVTFMCSSMETSNMRMIQLDVTVFECYLHVFLYGDHQHENDTTGCDCIWMLPSCVPLWRPSTWEWYNWMWLYLNVTFMCSSMESINMRMIQLDVTVFECYLHVFLYGDQQHENDTTGCDCIWMLPSWVPLWRPATWEWYNWMWLYLNVTFMCSSMETSNMRMIQLDVTVFECYLHVFLYGDHQHENDTTGCDCIWMLPSCVPLWRPSTWEWYNWMWLYLNVTFMCSSMETSNMRMIQLDVTVFECYLHVFLYGDQQHENDTVLL